jgi:methionyl-tRNA formyltransferase
MTRITSNEKSQAAAHAAEIVREYGPFPGASAVHGVTYDGKTKTGLTVFRPTDGLDEGPIILQKSCPIGPDETLGELYFNKLFPMGVAALLEAADLVVAGGHEERVQDESQAGYEGWVHEEESRIHWATHIDHVYNLVRGCNPAPGAWTMLDGVRVWLYDCRKHPVHAYGAVAGKPGDVAAISDTAIEINAHGGRLEVLRLRPEGGKKMSAGEFARERGLAIAKS